MKLPSFLTSPSALLSSFTYGEQLRPLRDWLIIASIGVSLLLLSAGWSYWLFQSISTENGGSGGSVATAPVSATSLEQVHTIFDKRASEKQQYLKGYTFVDPSR